MKTDQNAWIDEEQLRKALYILKPEGQLFELRALLKSPKKSISGYFTDIETAITELKKQHLRNWNVYITLNTIKDACYGRLQHDCFVASPEVTTSDPDVSYYQWLFIDFDPVRPSGISSSDAELEKARQLAKKVIWYLKKEGFEDPIVGMSGNGYHLLYSIGLANTEENTTLIDKVLKALDLMFSTEEISIDTGNYNPSRICKMYGTLAQKGTGTPERPHRMAYIVYAPPKIQQTSKVYLQKIADTLPKEEKPQSYNHYRPAQFDIRQWLGRYGVYYKEKQAGDYTKLILDRCPFNETHKAPDSMVTIGANGAIGFKCLHNSCQGKTWRDLRLMYEPDAYDKDPNDERIERGWEQHKVHNRDRQIDYADPDETADDRPPMFLTALQILDKPEEAEEHIATGIDGIDYRMRGLKKGAVSLLSGLRGGSKSTLLTTIILNAVNAGNNVLAYSGELTDKNFMKWMNLQAAGKSHVKQERGNFYYVTKDDQRKIAEWLGERFMLYNNEYGNDYTMLEKRIKAQIESQKTDLLILDNLMALDIRGLDRDKYEQQSQFVGTLTRMAKKANIHILFVAHPRKAQGFLRLDDVSGSGDLTNMVDNAFIIHRNNEDFKRLTKEMFKWKETDDVYRGTNIIEIAKDRDMGNQDVFIPLWYEPETKRLKNTQAETIHYGWEADVDDFIKVDFDNDESLPPWDLGEK